MPESLLRDIAVLLAAAAAVAVLCRGLGAPMVIGYLLAGFLIGPGLHGRALLDHPAQVRELMHLGVVFLVFAAGLEFRLFRLRELGARTAIAGAVGVLLMLLFGAAIGRALGWTGLAPWLLGAMLVPSSTIILTRGLAESRMAGRSFARLAVGLTLFEDLAMILILVAVTAIMGDGGVNLGDLGSRAVRLGGFLVVGLPLGLMLVPRLINRLFRNGQHEAVTVAVLGLCFGLAQLAALLGLSPAAGAFLAGLLAAESIAHDWIERRTGSLREFFTAIFFVSIGVLLDPHLLASHAIPCALLCAAFLLAKPLAVTLGGVAAGIPFSTALQASLALTHVGEFSFILAAAAVATGAVPHQAPPMIVALCVATAALSKPLIHHAHLVSETAERWMPGPLRGLLALYEWRLRASPPAASRPTWTALRRPALWLAAETAFLAALSAATGPIAAAVRGPSPAAPLSQWNAEWLVAGGAVAVGLPCFVAALRNIQALGMMLAEQIAPARGPGAEAGRFEQLLQRAFSGALTLALLLFLAIVSQPFLPPWPVTLAIGAAAAAAAVVFWRRLIHVHHRVEHAVQSSLERATDLTLPERQEARQVLEEFYPLGAALHEIALLPDSLAVGKTLRQLRLREETGATVLSVRRSGFEVVNPPADTPLFPEDHLLLVGQPSNLAAAEQFLAATRPTDPLGAARLWTLQLTERSPASGHTLRDLDLRRATGAAIVGITQAGEPILNPPMDSVLNPGDRLSLFGTISQLAAAGQLLGADLVP